MKAFYFLIPLFMINTCKTPAGTVISSEKAPMEKLENAASGCPKDGTCEVVAHKNKNLEIVDDGNGSIYSQIVEGDNIVVEYTYLKPGPEGTADGNYFETILFEVPTSTKNLVKENSTLADVKMIFSKHVFRNAGYYPVTNGKLSVQKIGKRISFNLKFKIDQTSQVISHINETVEIE